MRYEYKVIAAPNRGEKTKDAKTPTDRYAVAMATELNRMAAEGWDYLRAETLPSEERSGIAGRSTVYHNMLVFRRAAAALAEAPAAATADAPQPEYPVSASRARTPEPVPELPEAAAPRPDDHTITDAPMTTPQDSGPPATPPAPRGSQSD